MRKWILVTLPFAVIRRPGASNEKEVHLRVNSVHLQTRSFAEHRGRAICISAGMRFEFEADAIASVEGAHLVGSFSVQYSGFHIVGAGPDTAFAAVE